MAFCVDNRDLACYLVTKISWKGRYKRIFSIGTLCLTTYNPQSLEITNQWGYDDVIAVKPTPKSTPESKYEFTLFFRKKDKRDNMRFATEHISDLLNDCFVHFQHFIEKPRTIPTIDAFKHGWSGRRIPIRLRLTPFGVEQIDVERNAVIIVYAFRNMRNISKIKDCPGGFVIETGAHSRRHVFASQECDSFVEGIRRFAAEYVGVHVGLSQEPLALDDVLLTRLGLCSRDERLTSYVEFNVQKFSPRHTLAVRRLLCLSESCLIERDKATYHVICATPLNQIVCLVRLEKDPQQFVIEYADGRARSYSAPERDHILAALVDGARGSGNDGVFVTGHRFDRSLRILPFGVLLDEDAESQCMRHIINPPPGLKRADLIRRFNANIPYNGLTYSAVSDGFFTENKGKIIVVCLEAVLGEKYQKEEANSFHRAEAQLQCVRRLFASKSGFQAFTEVPHIRDKLGDLVVKFLAWKNEAIDHAVVEALCALMRPMHQNYELRTEQLNKQSLLSSHNFVEHLLDLVVKHVDRGSGSLVIASMLDFLTYAVCAPFSETTPGDIFDVVLKLVAIRGRSFYSLFHSPSMTIVKGAGMVMRALIEESDIETSKAMQLLALSEGAFLTHLNIALLSTGVDLRVLTNKQLSGHLLSLWLADCQNANELLARCIPRGLLEFLQSNAEVPIKEANLLLPRNNLEAANAELKAKNAILEKMESVKISAEASLERFIQTWDLEQKLNFKLTPRQDSRRDKDLVVLRKRRTRVRPMVNWKLFAYQFNQNHNQANLIWNEETRSEFRSTIENELRLLQSEKEQAGNVQRISWNYAEFNVFFRSLSNEIRIGDYFLRQLLAETDETATPIHNPVEFFNNVYHRFLLSTRSDMRCLCLKAMAITYGRHHISIGTVADAGHFVTLLIQTLSAAERDHLLYLLSKLVFNKANVLELLRTELVKYLIDIATLAHLHANRATVKNQTNVIEASSEQSESEGALEWYYQVKKDDRKGPFSYKTMKQLYESNDINDKTWIWASGMDTWEQLIKVQQFRWTICASELKDEDESTVVKKQAPQLYNFSELAMVTLDILLSMCDFFPSRDSGGCIVRPMPSIKLQLTQPTQLRCCVQLLLTYEPGIVQKVATLLHTVMQDNPGLNSLYVTGVFFFILMYNGSNVLPIARFLHDTHKKQAFKSSLPKFDGTHSVLSPLLPEAAIFYLEHYGSDKYAEVFLGEFDNPEIIWNNEMRRHLIEQIALHLSDFTNRLKSNVKVLYNFCPMNEIDYPELENELFCHVYYLRHLCDRQRFPDWPIRDPVPFLRSCLAAWHSEIDRKPPAMSVEMACDTLGIDPKTDQWTDPSFVRRSFLKLSLQYHPDKNSAPEARDMFQKISTAYEMLSSDKARSQMPDPQRIVLCLRAQSIVYSRHLKELGEYKYAGYAQLIRTIDLEAKDAQLFQKGGGALLAASIELAKYTLMSSALNAEELRRENGLEALQLAFDRCVPMISLSSTPEDMAVQVCEQICECLGTAAQFESCRQRVAEMASVFSNLCRLLHFPTLPRLAIAAAEAIAAMSVDTLLQMQLFQNGIIWQLIPHLFLFDFTLDDGGVQHSEDSNKQAQANSLARASLEALSCLAGFRDGCPENDGVRRSLRTLLTPYATRLMAAGECDSVLKALNTNTENPYLVWDNSTRAELADFVERQQTAIDKTSDLFGEHFTLSAHSKELIVGDVFIRIYNEQPTFTLEDPKTFATDLLVFTEAHADDLCGSLKKQTNGDAALIDWGTSPGGTADSRVLACFTALSNVMSNCPGVEVLLVGHIPLLIRYLRCIRYENLQFAALKVISLAVANKQCIADIATSRICSTLFVLLVKLQKAQQTILNILIAFTANGQLVKELLEFGGLLYILCVVLPATQFADATAMPERTLAAELLARLQSDKLTGPRWTRFINKFLPPIFSDALRDSTSTALTMLDSNNENPELIWNDSARTKVLEILRKSRDDLIKKQAENPLSTWDTSSIAEESWCAYGDSLSGELIVGGVFVRLYVANPGWAVRHPKYFCSELVEKVLEQLRSPGRDLVLVTTALYELLRCHPNIADSLPSQGYLPHFCDAMKSPRAEASRAAITILQQLAENEYCADGLCRLNCIEGIKFSMKNQPAMAWECSHALRLLMERQTGDLAHQLLNTGSVQFLLELLASSMPGVTKAAAARAEIVDCLKAASLDLKVGHEIMKILDASPIWAQYKEQRHDLFLPAARSQAITSGSTGIAGYITEGMFQPPPLASQPPPLHHSDLPPL